MQRQPGEGSRRAYVRPELTVHGDVGGVTRDLQGGTGQADSMASIGNQNFKTK